MEACRKIELAQVLFQFQKGIEIDAEKSKCLYPRYFSLCRPQGIAEAHSRRGSGGGLQRHEKLAAATRAAVKALGLELYAPDSPSNALTAVKVPRPSAERN